MVLHPLHSSLEDFNQWTWARCSVLVFLALWVLRSHIRFVQRLDWKRSANLSLHCYFYFELLFLLNMFKFYLIMFLVFPCHSHIRHAQQGGFVYCKKRWTNKLDFMFQPTYSDPLSKLKLFTYMFVSWGRYDWSECRQLDVDTCV